MNTRQTTGNTCYGCDDFGRLRRVLLHRPAALHHVTSQNYHDWLFDAAPDVERFIDEHDRYRELLQSHGVEVHELSECVNDSHQLISSLPNLTYLHDVAVVSCRGAVLSAMASAARRGEELVVREALLKLGIPIWHEFDDPADAFEGCLLLSRDAMLVADTERHHGHTIRKFINAALEAVEEVIYVAVPKARRFMHPDTVYNRVSERLALAYPPALGRAVLHTRGGASDIDFLSHMKAKGVEIIAVSDAEQAALACSFVPLQQGVIVHYEHSLSPATQRQLARRGVELILFRPRAMLAGGGSLRCLTLRLYREPMRQSA